MVASSSVFFTLRKHWKKSALGAVALCYGIHYGTKKYREFLIRREFFKEAKIFGDQVCGALDKPRRLYVVLNPQAGDGKAFKLFEKNAAPMLHLAGIDVTYIQTDYEGHGKTIINYIDPTVDGIVIGGGDGTVDEIITGILRQSKNETIRNLPIGVIPLGKDGNSLFRKLFGYDTCKVRAICNAAMAIVKGNTRKEDVVEIKADQKSVYAVSSIHIGAHEQVRSKIAAGKYWWLGRGKKYFAFAWRTVKDWPVAYSISVSSSELPSLRREPIAPQANQPVSLVPAAQCQQATSEHLLRLDSCRDISVSSTRTGSNGTTFEERSHPCDTFSLPRSSSYSVRYASLDSEHRLLVNNCSSTSEVALDTLGLSIYLDKDSSKKEPVFRVQTWQPGLGRLEFVRLGWQWMRNDYMPISSGLVETVELRELSLLPRAGQNLSYSIDGETFEAKPVSLILHRNRINVFCL